MPIFSTYMKNIYSYFFLFWFQGKDEQKYVIDDLLTKKWELSLKLHWRHKHGGLVKWWYYTVRRFTPFCEDYAVASH